MTAKLTALVAEDEVVARDTLCALLADFDWIECVGVAGDGRTALRLIDSLEPDLLFLDVQLPELDGLRVLEEARHRPAVVFTTAHDRYAVTAFDVQAVDYLLKPFGRRRLAQALERVRARLAFKQPVRLARTSSRQLVPLRLDAVSRFEAAGDYVEAHAGGAVHLLHMTLAQVEAELDAGRFWRIHRSHLVAADAVRAVREHEDERRLVVVLADGTEIVASRTASRRLRALIT